MDAARVALARKSFYFPSTVAARIRRAARTEDPVLLLGETGTGKSWIARAIHYLGRRKDGTFVRVNCAVLQPSIVESDLFGHERGAYTDAKRTREGAFERAERRYGLSGRGGRAFARAPGQAPDRARRAHGAARWR